jgi:hypothetical protein
MSWLRAERLEPCRGSTPNLAASSEGARDGALLNLDELMRSWGTISTAYLIKTHYVES